EPPVTGRAFRALGNGIVLVEWRGALADGDRMMPMSGDAPVGRVQVAVAVPAADGGTRTFVAFRLAAAPSAERPLTVRNQDGEALAALAPGEMPAPLDRGVFDGLGPLGRFRLLRFLLSLCARTFKLAGDPAYAAACRELVLAIAPEPAPLGFRQRLTPNLSLFEGRLPAELGRIDLTVAIGAEGIAPVAFAPQLRASEPAPAGTAACDLAVEHADRLGDGALVILFGEAGLACRRLEPAPRGAGLFRPAQAKQTLSAAQRSYALHCIGLKSRTDADCAALLREASAGALQPARRIDDPRQPVGAALEVAVGEGLDGVLISGWLRDPLGLVAAIRLMSPFGEAAVPPESLHRLRRADVAARYAKSAWPGGPADTGFVARVPFPEAPAPVRQYRLALTLASGNVVEVVAPPVPADPARARDAVLSAVPAAALTPAMLAGCIAPAAARLHESARAARGEPTVVAIGQAVAAPTVSLAIPLYRNLSFLRFQFAAFATDPAMRSAELVYVLDSPEQRDEAEHLLRGFHALYDLPLTLVVMAANAGYAAATNAGARVARGARLLLLNSDVVPEAPGWLPRMAAVLDSDPAIGAVGPKLLFDDGSIQHAGLCFARDFSGDWYNNHYYKGYPRRFALANVQRDVPGVTGAAVLMPRDLYESLGGICEDYVVGDYEDSDLCLRIRAAGRRIVYAPQAELFHFERRSIELHGGYADTVAAAYNRWLHAGRWSDAMAQAMADPEIPTGAGETRAVA
ncbi:MAG: glycosyltransferase family 2 protein, partial [Rhodospirillaceae bacterium]